MNTLNLNALFVSIKINPTDDTKLTTKLGKASFKLQSACSNSSSGGPRGGGVYSDNCNIQWGVF